MLRRIALALIFCVAWSAGARAAITFDQQVAGTGSAAASWTSSMSTAGTNRIVVAWCTLAVNGTGAPPAHCVPSGASLTWTLRNSWSNTGNDGSVTLSTRIEEYVTCAATQLTTQTITWTPTTTGYDVGRSDISSWAGQGCSTSNFEVAVKAEKASGANLQGTVTSSSLNVLAIEYGASHENNIPQSDAWSGSTNVTGGTNNNVGFVATTYNYRASTTGLAAVTMGHPTIDGGTTPQTAGTTGVYFIYDILCNPCSGGSASDHDLLLRGCCGN